MPYAGLAMQHYYNQAVETSAITYEVIIFDTHKMASNTRFEMPHEKKGKVHDLLDNCTFSNLRVNVFFRRRHIPYDKHRAEKKGLAIRN